MVVLVGVAFLADYYRKQEKQRRLRHIVCLAVLQDNLVALLHYHERHGEWPLDPQMVGPDDGYEIERRWGCQFNSAYDRAYLRPAAIDQELPPAEHIILFEKHNTDDGLLYVVGFADGHGERMDVAVFEYLLEKTGQTIP